MAIGERQTSNDALLRIDDVTCRFGEILALESTSIDINEGEFVSIIGPSGCGKSTLMNVIAGLTEPTTGKVILRDEDITGTTGHVGYMFQKDLLVPWRTVLGNITLGASLRGRVTRREIDAAAGMAQRYGLGEFVDNYPHTLSGGMRQRVALMRTLALVRPIVLLDEPFGALDSQTRAQLQEWLLSVWTDTGGTVLFITHDVEEALILADRLLVMSARPGRITGEIRVDLDRPRSIAMTTSREFVELKRRAMAILYGAGETAPAVGTAQP